MTKEEFNQRLVDIKTNPSMLSADREKAIELLNAEFLNPTNVAERIMRQKYKGPAPREEFHS